MGPVVVATRPLGERLVASTASWNCSVRTTMSHRPDLYLAVACAANVAFGVPNGGQRGASVADDGSGERAQPLPAVASASSPGWLS
jgi:hypothetical protein